MLATKTVSPRPAFLGMRASNTNVRQGRMAMRIRAEEGAEKQAATKASPATLRYGLFATRADKARSMRGRERVGEELLPRLFLLCPCLSPCSCTLR
jgi:hypothetical protein